MNDSSSSELAQPQQAGTTGEGEESGDEASSGSEQPSGERRLPKDVVFGLLSAKRRRDVLTYLADNGPETTLSDLADHIAADENDTEIRLLSSQQRKRVYVALYQCHLPRMDDADVIDFEHSRGTVELRPEAAELYQYMEVSPTDADDSGEGSEDPIADRVKTVRSKLGGWVQG